MTPSIPVYNADGSLYACVSEQRLARLQSGGLVARVVRHRKGHINRAILFASPNDPTPTSLSAYQGTRYSHLEKLESGPQCWRLRPTDETWELGYPKCLREQRRGDGDGAATATY